MSGQARRRGILRLGWERLSTWAEAHRHALHQSLRSLRARPLSSLATALVLGLVLALPALGRGVMEGLAALESRLEAEAEWILFPEGQALHDLQALADALARDPRIASLRIRDAEENLATLLAQPGFGDLVDLLGENPLPPILILRPSASLAPEAREALLRELGERPGIALALPSEDWRSELRRWLDRGRAVLMPIGLLLALATLAVLFNTLRLDLLERAEEIEVVRLLGASDGFVQRPFLYVGLWLGSAAGTVAALLSRGVLLLLEGSLAAYALDGEVGAMLLMPSLRGSMAVVAFGAALGLSGAWLAVRVHLARLP